MKARIVDETLRPGAPVREVAQRHGLKANHISSWRSLARNRKLVLPAPEYPVEFATLVVAPVREEETVAELAASTGPEIVLGSVIIRLEPGASPGLDAATGFPRRAWARLRLPVAPLGGRMQPDGH